MKNIILGEEAYFIWDIITVRLGYDRILLEDVMDQLWCYDDFNFAALHGLGTGIDELTWSTSLLTFRCSLGQKQTL